MKNETFHYKRLLCYDFIRSEYVLNDLYNLFSILMQFLTAIFPPLPPAICC